MPDGSNNEDVVDLTLPEESDSEVEVVQTNVTVNPLRANDARRQRLRRLAQRRAARRAAAAAAAANAAGTANDGENEDIEVVDETVLSGLERLRRVQEQHARGETVQPQRGSGSYGYRSDRLMSFLMNPLMQRQRRELPTRTARTRARLGGAMLRSSLFGTNVFSPTYNEDAVMEWVRQESFDDYSAAKGVDAASVRKPPEPAPAREGFTRRPGPGLVCVRCLNALGSCGGEEKTEFSKENSSRVFVRGCGHVYCGLCVHHLRTEASPRARACPVQDCRIANAKKRGFFREMFV